MSDVIFPTEFLEMVEKKELSFKENITEEELKEKLNLLFEYEPKYFVNCQSDILVNLKNQSTEIKKIALQAAMQNDGLKNLSLILNIMILLKDFTHFGETLFDDKNVYFTSIEEILDIDLDDDIYEMRKKIALYFFSLFKSLSKVEYASIDNDINLPNFYHTLFLSSDFVTIGGLIEPIKETLNFKLINIRHANAYIEALSNKYALGDVLLSSFLGELKSNEEDKLKKQIRNLKRKINKKQEFARRW